MTKQLTKGANIALTDGAAPGHAYAVGVAWADPGADLDVVALVCDSGKKVLGNEYFLFWDQPRDPRAQVHLRWVPHGTDAPGPDRAQALFNLADLSDDVHHIYLALATIAAGVTVAAARDFIITVRDLTAGVEVATYRSDTTYGPETCAVLAEVYRYKDQWKLRVHDAGYSGGLAAFGRDYGAEIA